MRRISVRLMAACLLAACDPLPSPDAGVDAGFEEIPDECEAARAPTQSSVWIISTQQRTPGPIDRTSFCTPPEVTTQACGGLATVRLNGGLQPVLHLNDGSTLSWNAPTGLKPPALVDGQLVRVSLSTAASSVSIADGGTVWWSSGGSPFSPGASPDSIAQLLGVSVVTNESCRAGDLATCQSRFLGHVLGTSPETRLPFGAMREVETPTGRWQVLWNQENRLGPSCPGTGIDMPPPLTSTGHVFSRVGP